MAVIPRYISETRSTPAISNARIDPNTAAAPYRAAEASTKNVMNVLQNELGQWHQTLVQKEKEAQAAQQKNEKIQAGLYKADAMANLAIQSNQLQQELVQRNDGNLNLAKEFDQGFQKLADQVLLNAPTEDARLALTKNIIAMRADAYNKMTNTSIKMNNQLNMDRMENMLQQYEGYAAAAPESIEAIKQNSAEIFNSMKDLGIPEAKRQAIVNKFSNRLDYHAARAVAEKDPLTAMEQIEKGALAHLGAGNITALKNVATASKKAFERQANDAIRDVEARLNNGQPLPADFEARLDTAKRYGLTEQVEDLTRLMQVDKMVSQSSLSSLKQMQAELSQMISSGELDLEPARAKKLTSFVEGNIKAMTEDGLGYAERKGGFTPFREIVDFTQIDPNEAEQRKFRAAQVESAYGVPATALKASEIDTLSAQIKDAPTMQKLQILNNLNQFGSATSSRVADKIMNSDPGLAQALRLGTTDLEIANGILKGQEIIATKSGTLPTADEVNDDAASLLGNLFAEEPAYRSQYVQAGKAIYAYEHSRGNDISMKDAIARAGNMVEVKTGWFSKYATVAPGAGMSADDFTDFVDTNLKNLNTWRTYGNGLPANAANRVPIKFAQVSPSDFEYLYNSRGFYEVYYNGDPVITDKGSPLAIDLKKLYNEMKGK